MYKEKTMLFLYSETPIHPGAGMGTGYIDLPIQRESFSDFPVIRASSLKGSLRDYFESFPDPNDADYGGKVLETFGPSPGPGASEYAGALGVGEAKLLLFPIRSLYGVFAYLTCPLILQRFKRDLTLAGHTENISIPEVEEDKAIIVYSEDNNSIGNIISKNGRAVFNEFSFQTQEEEEDINDVASYIKKCIFPEREAGNDEYMELKKQFYSRFAIVSDSVFKDLSSMATEVITRNRIDDNTGVVAEAGGLWVEELLPSETVFYSVLLSANPFRANSILNEAALVIKFFKDSLNNRRFQIGGDHSIGRGIVSAHFLPEEVKNDK